MLVGTQVQQLPRVVPLVEALRGVKAFVALQAHELTPGDARQRLCYRRLADARLSLQQERLAEFTRQEDGGGQPVIREIGHRLQRLLHVFGVLEAPCRASLRRVFGCGHPPARSSSSPRKIFSGVIGMLSTRTPHAS